LTPEGSPSCIPLLRGYSSASAGRETGKKPGDNKPVGTVLGEEVMPVKVSQKADVVELIHENNIDRIMQHESQLRKRQGNKYNRQDDRGEAGAGSREIGCRFFHGSERVVVLECIIPGRYQISIKNLRRPPPASTPQAKAAFLRFKKSAMRL